MLDHTASSSTPRRTSATRKPARVNKRATGPVDKAIGTSVRLARLARKKSQTDLGNILGVTFQQIQKYENGTNRLSTARLLQIAAALAVPFVDLIGEADGVRKSGKPSADLELLATCAPARRLFDAVRLLATAGKDQTIAKIAGLAEDLAGKT